MKRLLAFLLAVTIAAAIGHTAAKDLTNIIPGERLSGAAESVPLSTLHESDEDNCWWYNYSGDAHYTFQIPDEYGDDFFNERFTADLWMPVLLSHVRIWFSNDYPEFSDISGQGVDIIVWDNDGYAFPGTELARINVPAADMAYYPDSVEVDFLPFCIRLMDEDFHVGYTVVDQLNDNIAIYTDDGYGPAQYRSSEYWNGTWELMLDAWGVDVDFLIVAELCDIPAIPAQITCPTDTNWLPQCYPAEACIELPIEHADSVSVGADATWEDDSLCFTPDTSGLYIFEVNATSACGSDLCSVFVEVSLGEEPWIACPPDTLRAYPNEPGDICIELHITNYDTVDTPGAVWGNDTLCFYADTNGVYAYEVTATNDCGQGICAVFVHVEGPPPILSTSPAQNALSAPTSASISVTFEIDMDETSFSSSTFVVTSRSAGFIEGAISYDHPTRTVTFDPAIEFYAGEPVTVTLTPDIKSSSGEPLDRSFVWSFTTAVSEESPGTFPLHVNYSVGDNTRSIFGADFDGDGDIDLAAGNNYDYDISILLNNGYGAFTVDTTYETAGSPQTICAADLDRDGDIDLASAAFNFSSITILNNDGNANFSDFYWLHIWSATWAVGAADMDGDGDQDLAVAKSVPSSALVLFNDGDGTFGSQSPAYPVGSNPYSICAADFDNDGDFDISTANPGWACEARDSTMSVLLNNGVGTFAPQTEYPVGYHPSTVCAADLDGDGYVDLATANLGYFQGYPVDSTVSILFNKGDGLFTPHIQYSVGARPYAICAGDVDGDGDLDLVTASVFEHISILINYGDGSFAPYVVYPIGGDAVSIFAADFDGDGDLDLATADMLACNVTVLLNQVCTDSDGDGYGDPGYPENECPDDNCPTVPNFDQIDSDDDSFGDACDNCADFVNPEQEDSDGDIVGDSCDNCVYALNPDQEDTDSDTVGDSCDNCILVPNPDQADSDGDNIGDACDWICGDADDSGDVDIDDTVYLINYIFAGGPPPDPYESGDTDCSGDVDIDDVVYLIAYIFSGGYAPCDPNGDEVPDC